MSIQNFLSDKSDLILSCDSMKILLFGSVRLGNNQGMHVLTIFHPRLMIFHLCIMSSIPSYPLISGWHLSIRDYKGPLCMWAFIIYNWYRQIVFHGQTTFLFSEEWVWVIAAWPLWQCKTIVVHAWHWQCWSYFASRDAIWFLREYFGNIITQWTKAPNYVVIPQHM